MCFCVYPSLWLRILHACRVGDLLYFSIHIFSFMISVTLLFYSEYCNSIRLANCCNIFQYDSLNLSSFRVERIWILVVPTWNVIIILVLWFMQNQYFAPPNFKRLLSAKLKALATCGKLMKVMEISIEIWERFLQFLVTSDPSRIPNRCIFLQWPILYAHW